MSYILPAGGNSYKNYTALGAPQPTGGMYSSSQDFGSYLNNNHPFDTSSQNYHPAASSNQQQYPSYMAQTQQQYPSYMAQQQPMQQPMQQPQYPNYMALQQQQKQQFANYMAPQPQQPPPPTSDNTFGDFINAEASIGAPSPSLNMQSVGSNGLDFGMTNDPVEQARRQAQQRMDFQAANPGQSMDNALKGLNGSV